MAEQSITFDEFLNCLREESHSTTEQGRKFETAMVALLPQLAGYEFAEAWLWRDWPQREAVTGLNAQDIGIDIVARLRDREEYWAVQCKFYDPDSAISHGDLGTFYTASGREGFSGRLIVSTTDKWTDHAENMLEGQQMDTRRLRLQDLREHSIDWNWARPDLTRLTPPQKKTLYPRQQEALDKACAHFEEHDRGQLIMACGTGKTFTSLRIAEAMVPNNGFVLFVVPSLSLMKQTIGEWVWQSNRDCRYFGICSDDTVGHQDEFATHVADITVPVSTNPGRIKGLLSPASPPEKGEGMTVVFCTYQSLDRLSLAQQMGAPEFDLIICDEAHRTTGLDREAHGGENDRNSNFVNIHDNDFVGGRKRLYMTATPRIYTEGAQSKAKERNLGVYSMDDKERFGEEFFRLGFRTAVEEGLLSDYKVIIFNLKQDYVAGIISQFSQQTISDIDASVEDVAKIIGCYKALRDQGDKKTGINLKRAVSFSSSIKNSKMVVEKFKKVVDALNEYENDEFTCKLKHVDGKNTALDRSRKLDWLRDDVSDGDPVEVCRILSNAKCLTEGVDVPSLDAILFMNPRRSHVDVVQAVGRVMRKAEGKDYGYVILPVVIPEGDSIEDALNSNEAFAIVWDVLRALRAHDDRLTGEISKLELNDDKSGPIVVIGDDGTEPGNSKGSILDGFVQLGLPFSEELANAIYAKIVDKVGDRRYLEQWAKETANIHDLLVKRINYLREEHKEVREIYTGFLKSLHVSIHDGLDEDDASSMLAQQLITQPIFDELFHGYKFSHNNVVATALSDMLDKLKEYGLETEIKELESFYKSVKDRVSGLDNDGARQKVITELYEKFFTTAFPKTSESLGISYTPIELVDFTLNSADVVMREEFGRGLTDEGVHIIDPFIGTGSFIVRLLNNSELINDNDLERKFAGELWANEILLLAYYIASVNVEMIFHQRNGGEYQPFQGISLTDTFELFERGEDTLPEMLEGNSERIKAQRNAPIRVVVGNPPWSAGQRSQNDNNANRVYPNLDESIRGTYAKRSNATNLNALYDSYIRAIRWASDRIGDEGVVAFVTNAGWLDGTSMDGMRLTLEEEFDAIWLFNLRGNARTSGEQRRKEAGHVFGQSSRAPVVISLFVKNPNNRRAKAEIHYHDIGDYRKRDEKLHIISEAKSIMGLPQKTITPNDEGDWLNLRNPLFQKFVEIGNDEVRRGKVAEPETIFRSYSSGLISNRDAWVYNFSRDKVAANMARMIDNYNEQVANLNEVKKQNPDIDPDAVLSTDGTYISWASSLIHAAQKGKEGNFDAKRIVPSLYRLFTMKHLYLDPMFIQRQGKVFEYFPERDSENCLICLTGMGATDFSVFLSTSMPDVNMFTPAQVFPRWLYHNEAGEYVPEENITNHALSRFQTHYKDEGITKERIFDYVYGILHAPDYREQFAADLRLGLPRIPMAKDFWAFADAGAALGDYHLKWPLDAAPGYKTELNILVNDNPIFNDMLDDRAYDVKKMRWKERPEGRFIQYNTHLSIGPIPKEAFDYTIGGRTPLQWLIDRYQIKTDKASGITNDPNDWIAEQGRRDALLELIKRVTFMSIQTAKIIEELPPAV